MTRSLIYKSLFPHLKTESVHFDTERRVTVYMSLNARDLNIQRMLREYPDILKHISIYSVVIPDKARYISGHPAEGTPISQSRMYNWIDIDADLIASRLANPLTRARETIYEWADISTTPNAGHERMSVSMLYSAWHRFIVPPGIGRSSEGRANRLVTRDYFSNNIKRTSLVDVLSRKLELGELERTQSNTSEKINFSVTIELDESDPITFQNRINGEVEFGRYDFTERWVLLNFMHIDMESVRDQTDGTPFDHHLSKLGGNLTYDVISEIQEGSQNFNPPNKIRVFTMLDESGALVPYSGPAHYRHPLPEDETFLKSGLVGPADLDGDGVAEYVGWLSGPPLDSINIGTDRASRRPSRDVDLTGRVP